MKTITPSTSRTTHAALSHPEPEDRPARDTAKARYWQIDAGLRDRLAAAKLNGNLTNDALGRRLGLPDGTVVSKYLNDRMDRDPSDFEGKVRDLLAADSRRREFGGNIVETNVVKKVAAFIDRVRATGSAGVFTGQAGIGKTVGAQAYAAANPITVLLTVNAAQNDAQGIKQLLWSEAGPTVRGNESHYAQLVRKFAGSQRPLIFDNAQRLGAGGRSFIYDFRDATGCPVIFLGNPIILRQIARIDQEHSRTARHGEAELKDPERVTRRIIADHISDADSIIDLALQVVTKPYGGHLRALNHLLSEMRVLMELEANAQDPRGCFMKALAASIDHTALALAS